MRTILIIICCASINSLAQRYKSQVFDSVDVAYDVLYGRASSQAGVNTELKMDIYRPKGDTVSNRPLIVLAHGGFFLFGEKDWFDPVCLELAKHGYVAATIQYRLIDDIEGDSVWTPKRAAIDAVYDMKAAVRFFNKDYVTHNNYKINPENIFIGGYSAGAIASLHYAYVNTPEDVFRMGGKEMLEYVWQQGGVEGSSGNQGYSSRVKGVINIAGALYHADLLDKDEPILYSVHGTADDIVPFTAGITGGTLVETEGSGLIHKRANEVGLKNHLNKLVGKDHAGFWYCYDCVEDMITFISENL